MRYLFEVLGDNEPLAKAEIRGVLESSGKEYDVLADDNGVLACETLLPIEKFDHRMGLTRTIDEYLLKGSLDEVRAFLANYHFQGKSYCVRVRKVGKHGRDVKKLPLEKDMGAILWKKGSVDLEDPEVEFRLVLSNESYLGIKMTDIERKSMESRKVQFRPFFSPVSLHPKLARALVNLSRAREGNTLLDPFCGTGGVLIEGAMMGMEVIGADIKQRMVEGSGENLNAAGLGGKLIRADISDLPNLVGKVDAIATDPPYGRSASTMGEEISDLYERSFRCFRKVLRKGRYLAIILPKKEHLELGAEHLELIEKYPVRVHRSLTRNFAVYRNP